VVAVAWAGATTGGAAGWLLGVKGGRGLLTAPGPLLALRLALIARGDRFYERYGLVAVLFTPSWIAGIHDMRWSRFLPVNAVSAVIWPLAFSCRRVTCSDRPITDIAADAGLAGQLLLGTLLGARRGSRSVASDPQVGVATQSKLSNVPGIHHS